MTDRTTGRCGRDERAVSVAREGCGGITIDMPHGWWRVDVNSDGSGTVAFGALLCFGAFGPGTDLKRICADFREKAAGSREELGEPVGTVRFSARDNPDRLWYFDDWAAASDLFEKVWNSREPPVSNFAKQHLESLSESWEKRALPE